MSNQFKLLKAATVIAFSFSLACLNASAQDYTALADSTVTVMENGDTLIEYHMRAPLPRNKSWLDNTEPRNLYLTEEEKARIEEASVAQHDSIFKSRSLAPRKEAVLRSGGNTDYAVGAIQMQEGVSPSGARTYEIPIPTAAGFNLVPSVSIGYNSQAGVGLVGYGWDIHGISVITLINRNIYYHGNAKAANTTETSGVYALDGVPLVTNDDSATASSYPLITATGHVLVAPSTNNHGYVSKFTVLYPNGMRAVFGQDADVEYMYPAYYITEMQDIDGNRMTFHYSVNVLNGSDVIQNIRYGYDSSGNYAAEISFGFETRFDQPYGYFAGKPVLHDDKLIFVNSKDGNDRICRYEFTYEETDNTFLLSRVECTSGDEALPPLEFTYGADDFAIPGSGFLYGADSLNLSAAYLPTGINYCYKRGKFVGDRYNDGILIYPDTTTYEVINSKYVLGQGRTYEFGSRYPADQQFLFAACLDGGVTTVNTSLMAGSGFQTIEPVDVDGDGLDEIVKVNLAGTIGTRTKLHITVYECSNTGVPTVSSAFDIMLNGVIVSGNYTSPYRYEYFWGDFLGNGRIQLLTIAYDKNYNPTHNYNQISYAALIDINMQQKVCDSYLFGLPEDKVSTVITCDIDADTRTELCHATNVGFDIYRIQSSAFVKEATLSAPTASILAPSNTQSVPPYHITDLNGDGYMDIVRTPSVGLAIWNYYAYNGSSFETGSLNLDAPASGDRYFFIDLNRDGFADAVKINGTTMGSCINKNGRSFESYVESADAVDNAKGIVTANVIDYCGMSSFIKVKGFFAYSYAFSSPSPELRQLIESRDSYGRTVCNEYKYLPEKSRVWFDSSFQVNNAAGYMQRVLPIYVLYSENAYAEDNYGTPYRNRLYSYYNGVVHNFGLGFCGFAKIRTDDQLGSVREITDESHDPERRGILTSTQVRYNLSAPPLRTIANTYDNHSTTYGKLNPRLVQSVESNTVTGINTTTTLHYDAFDFPDTLFTSRSIGSGTPQTEKLVRTYTHSNSPTKYVLGSISEEYTLKESNGYDDLSWKERDVFTFDANYHPLTRKHYVGSYGQATLVLNPPIFHPTDAGSVQQGDAQIQGGGIGIFEPIDSIVLEPPVHTFIIQLDATNLVSETHWTYDSHGNILSETVAPYSATQYTGDSYTYDSKGRYVISHTDALGHTTTYSGYNRFGRPASATDYRGRVTSYTYDAWGNLTRTDRPDGTSVEVSPAWGGEGLYTVTSTETGNPDVIIHYDALDREVRRGQKHSDGLYRYTDRQYDSRGRLLRESRPFVSPTTRRWYNWQYDMHDRPTRKIDPSGRMTTWSYNGTSVTHRRDSVWSTTTRDASGNMVSVQDEGGTVTYTLRDDGQPLKITAPGGVETSFGYDFFGRRTMIEDPSAGRRSESYVWNADGSSQVTHTNPNGTVKIYTDMYGRTTSVERIGEYTTNYTYDSYGLLSGEQSTNGTSNAYTYDALDRPLTVTHTVPDGKWLRETYSYGSDGNVSSILYTSQDGNITTESYTYTYGNLSEVSLPDGSPIYRVLNENEQGLLTKVRTGSIDRDYGYNAASGLPTSRSMDGGDLQDFTYSFNPHTRNLSSRTDASRSVTESFGYDALGRLSAIGTRQIEYADNGNMVSFDGVGQMYYDNGNRPYQITTFSLASDNDVPNPIQHLSYTCFDRPDSLAQGNMTASFTYGADDERVKMAVADTSGTAVLTRYYAGGRYECDLLPGGGSAERLYLGGDAYSAPMVYRRVNGGSWMLYNIGRDYLGSVTHIATADGTLVAEYSYDAWGRLRNPATLQVYSPGSEPELFLGRGFTGHEHLPWFGLVNMNARLYDPLLGRFLSPDPYVQAPDFTQNFNRYSYALNNPLKYMDEGGEYVLLDDVLATVGGGVWNWLTNGAKFTKEGLSYFGIGAAGGLASLYISPVLSAGIVAGVNNIISQGFGEDGKWDGSNIDGGAALFSGFIGAASAYVGGALSSQLSSTLGKLTSKIPGKAWAGMLNRGITGWISGMAMGASVTALNQLGHDKKLSWSDIWDNALSAGLLGLTSGAIAGTAEGIKSARNEYKNPWTNAPWYPPKKGFLGKPEVIDMPVGTYDRFGGDQGFFLSPDNTPFEQRSLPSFKNDMSIYSKYRIIQPIPGVKKGIVAPWFGYPGGGIQFYLPKSIEYYIINGFIIKL